jgi:hypothetical protein
MAALVQSFPQQSTSTVTMLQTRPTSASGMLQNPSPVQTQQQYANSSSHMHRNSYHGIGGGVSTTYRGQTSMAPVAPYAFTSTPGLAGNGAKMQAGSPYLRQDQRTASAPAIPTVKGPEMLSRSRYPAAASVSTNSTSSSSASDLSSGTQLSGSRDDSTLASPTFLATRVARPNSTLITSTTIAATPPTLLAVNSPTSGKPSPDRYRRPGQKRAENGPPSPQPSSPLVIGAPQLLPMNKSNNAALKAAVDEMYAEHHRSIYMPDLGNFTDAQLKAFSKQAQAQQGTMRASSASGPQDYVHPLRSSPVSSRPASSPGRSGSTESVSQSVASSVS